MSRLMSVSLTEQAVRERRKTVTRRLGWRFAKPGDRVTLCRKVMGRKPGEPLVRIAEVELVDVRREPLSAITDMDVEREGGEHLPLEDAGRTRAEAFASWFAWTMGISVDDEVTRIEWRYLAEAGGHA
jgi:hypothetical protein